MTMKQNKMAFSALSSKICKTNGCNRHIKQNVLDRNPAADLCYRCFKAKEAGRGHFIVSAKERRAKCKPEGGNINRATTEDIRNGRRGVDKY
jgi:hypothetical protein